MQDREFERNEEKNKILQEKRGISFEKIIKAVNDGQLIEILPHHNPEKYPNQKILAVLIDNYVYSIPFVLENNICFLKTAFKDRNLTKFYFST